MCLKGRLSGRKYFLVRSAAASGLTRPVMQRPIQCAVPIWFSTPSTTTTRLAFLSTSASQLSLSATIILFLWLHWLRVTLRQLLPIISSDWHVPLDLSNLVIVLEFRFLIISQFLRSAMTVPPVVPTLQVEDLFPPETHLASRPPNVATADPTNALQPPEDNPRSRAQSVSELESRSLLSLIPSLSAKKFQTALTLADIIDDDGSEPPPHDLASAEASIARASTPHLFYFIAFDKDDLAADTSFIELSSGPAARELKRRWDLQIGVGKSVRSPYAITAFVNQHGKQMFRVGYVCVALWAIFESHSFSSLQPS